MGLATYGILESNHQNLLACPALPFPAIVPVSIFKPHPITSQLATSVKPLNPFGQHPLPSPQPFLISIPYISPLPNIIYSNPTSSLVEHTIFQENDLLSIMVHFNLLDLITSTNSFLQTPKKFII